MLDVAKKKRSSITLHFADRKKKCYKNQKRFFNGCLLRSASSCSSSFISFSPRPSVHGNFMGFCPTRAAALRITIQSRLVSKQSSHSPASDRFSACLHNTQKKEPRALRQLLLVCHFCCFMFCAQRNKPNNDGACNMRTFRSCIFFQLHCCRKRVNIKVH